MSKHSHHFHSYGCFVMRYLGVLRTTLSVGKGGHQIVHGGNPVTCPDLLSDFVYDQISCYELLPSRTTESDIVSGP